MNISAKMLIERMLEFGEAGYLFILYFEEGHKPQEPELCPSSKFYSTLLSPEKLFKFYFEGFSKSELILMRGVVWKSGGEKFD